MINRCMLIGLFACVLAGLTTASWAASNSKYYVITLSSSLDPYRTDDYPSVEFTNKYHVFITEALVNNHRWYRLNVGFFDSSFTAGQVLAKLKREKRFHDAWVRHASAAEYREHTKPAAPAVIRKKTTAATVVASAPAKVSAMKPNDQVKWNGSFSQFSSREIMTYDDGSTENINVLRNDLGTQGRYRGKAVNINTDFDSSYRYTVYDDNSLESEWLLSSLHLGFNFIKQESTIVLGRQFANSGGVLGRFDGVWLSQRVSPKWGYSLFAGYPVDLYDILPIDETDRHFTGISLDMGRFANAWDSNVYGISQEINGIVDRQAVGGEIRYSSRKRSHLLLLDYDVSYDKVNTFVLSSNWVLPARFTINLLLDSRTIPTLATSTALWGRTESGIDELLAIMAEEEIRQLARDRTTRGDTVTVGLSRPLDDHYQISMEFTSYYQTDMIASGGVDELLYGGRQHIEKLTFIGTSMFKKR